MLLVTAGIKTFTACVDIKDDIQTAITTIKKHNAFNVIVNLKTPLLSNFFEECG